MNMVNSREYWRISKSIVKLSNWNVRIHFTFWSSLSTLVALVILTAKSEIESFHSYFSDETQKTNFFASRKLATLSYPEFININLRQSQPGKLIQILSIFALKQQQQVMINVSCLIDMTWKRQIIRQICFIGNSIFSFFSYRIHQYSPYSLKSISINQKSLFILRKVSYSIFRHFAKSP